MSSNPTGAAAPGSGTACADAAAIGASQGHDQPQLHIEPEPGLHMNADANDDDPSSIAVVNPPADDRDTNSKLSSKPTGLHSPPESNNVDASSDSELSDLDEAIANADDMDLDLPRAPPATLQASAQTGAPTGGTASVPSIEGGSDAAPDQPEQVPTPAEDEDIGEILPDEWSGAVPIFRPTMDQFKDFKKFVCSQDGSTIKFVHTH